MTTMYLDAATHRKLKSQLTRAKNTKEPVRVLMAVEAALNAWEGKAWPDQWHTWNIALSDAWYAYLRSDAAVNPSIRLRFRQAMDRMGG